MSDTWKTIHQRGQQTLAVWKKFDDTFTVGELARLIHETNVKDLPAQAQAADTQEDALDAARTARDAVMALIKDLAVRLPRKLDGELPPDDALHRDLEDIRSIEMTSLETVADRGRKVYTVWSKYNARLGAQTPPKPGLKVGQKTVADLDAALTDLPRKTQAVEDERAVLSDKRSALRDLSTAVDSGNKRWYAAWQGEHTAGTPENAALSQVETGTSAPAPKPSPTPAPVPA